MSKKKQKSLKFSTTPIGVKTLPHSDLYPNPHNPRKLFDKAPLATLQASIESVGILVPLTVYYDSKKERYIILDGQRRWLCAKNLDLKQIPVNQVAEPTLVQNIVTMFQIHKLREDWELMPSALKLELLMDELQEKNPKKLAALTGLDQAVVIRCKKLLTFSKKYQDMMLDPDPDNRLKADFFIELYPVITDRLVKSFGWFKRDAFIKKMLKRYLDGKLRSVTDFRRIKQCITLAKNAELGKTISKRLSEFADDSDLGIDHLEISEASVAVEANGMTKLAAKLAEEISGFDVDSFIGESELWESLISLREAIETALLKAGWRSK